VDQDVNILAEFRLQNLATSFILWTKCASCFWWILYSSSVIQISFELWVVILCWEIFYHVHMWLFFLSKKWPFFVIANIYIGDSFVGKKHWNDRAIGKKHILFNNFAGIFGSWPQQRDSFIFLLYTKCCSDGTDGTFIQYGRQNTGNGLEWST